MTSRRLTLFILLIAGFGFLRWSYGVFWRNNEELGAIVKQLQNSLPAASPVKTIQKKPLSSPESNSQNKPLTSKRSITHSKPLSTINACNTPPNEEFRHNSSTIISDHFLININAQGLSDSFKHRLIKKLDVIFETYAELIDAENLRTVRLNINIFKDKQSFNQYIQKNGHYSSTITGVYFHHTGSANIIYRGEKQTMQTALHESVHAINHALIGRTPGWLNEGMAEYFEHTASDPGADSAAVVSDWTDHKGNFRYKQFDLPILLSHEDYWYQDADEDNRKLYANSWLWINYLMGSDAGVNVLSSVLKQELQDPCSILDKDAMYELILDTSPYIESDYLYWLDEHYPMLNSE
ncbi:hypothetical protein [Psychromonas aquimarina]|uniref:hypothetical protein n=1 Tax=Psychromonas aquimarina TaxID=444919 RepID=UPI00048ED4F8|nr:hypothetical protein [Psychromonas aquimarina]